MVVKPTYGQKERDFNMYHGKVNAGLSLTPECLDMLVRAKDDLGFRSKNELAETAIRFYIAHETAEHHTDYLAKKLTGASKEALREMENRIAKITYKMAVETAMLNLVLTDQLDLSADQIRKYRQKAVAILNQTHEPLNLDRARKFKAQEVLHNIIPTYDPDDAEHYTPYGSYSDDEDY